MTTLPEVQYEAQTLEELNTKNGNYLLPTEKTVKLTPDNYNISGFAVTNRGDISKSTRSSENKTTLELTGSGGTDSNAVEKNVNFVVQVSPNLKDAFLVTNTNTKDPITVWIYGEKKILKPGEEINVSSLKPEKYKDLEGVENGSFFVQLDSARAVKVSKQPLSNEVTVRHFSFDNPVSPKKETDNGHEEGNYTKEEYELAKTAILEELRAEKDNITEDIEDFEEILRTGKLTEEEREKAEQFIKQDRAALVFLENPTDDLDTRKLVAAKVDLIADWHFFYAASRLGSERILDSVENMTQGEKKQAERIHYSMDELTPEERYQLIDKAEALVISAQILRKYRP